MNHSTVLTKLYPVVLALANIGVGIGLAHFGALLFALVMWLGGGLVLLAALSTTASDRAFHIEDSQDLSVRHPR